MSRHNNDFDNAIYQLEKYEYKYRNLLRLLLLAQFQFTGIPNDKLKSSHVSDLLYNRGCVVWFKDRDLGDDLVCMPCNVRRYDALNNPVEVYAYSNFGTGNSYTYALDDPSEFVVMYDTITRNCSRNLLLTDIMELAQISVSINLNVMAQRTPVILRYTPQTKLSVQKLFDNFVGGIPAIDMKRNPSKDVDLNEYIQSFKLDVPFVADKLELQRQKVWNACIERVGYKINVNSMKKERQVTEEINGNLEETIGFYEIRRAAREEGIQEIRNKLQVDIGLKEVTAVQIGGETYESVHNGAEKISGGADQGNRS